MNFLTVNQLITDHLRFYGYQLAARIVESEFKSKAPRDQPGASKLFELLQKFVELYGKPDLWGLDKQSTSTPEPEEKRIYLPRKDRAPFKGSHGNKSESYGGPFGRKNDNREPYRYTAGSERIEPIDKERVYMGREAFVQGGEGSPYLAGNGSKGNEAGTQGQGSGLKGYSQPTSYLTSISKALRDKSPGSVERNGVSIDHGISKMKRNVPPSNNRNGGMYVGPYMINNTKMQGGPRGEDRSFEEEREMREHGAGSMNTQSDNDFRSREKVNYKGEKRSTSVSQVEYAQGNTREGYYGKSKNYPRHESFAESENSVMEGEQSFISAYGNDRVRNPNEYYGRKGPSGDPLEQLRAFKKGGSEREDEFGRRKNPYKGNQEGDREDMRKDWRAFSDKKPSGGSMTQNYNAFLSRRLTFGRGDNDQNQDKPFGNNTSGVQRRGIEGGDLPPVYRDDNSEASSFQLREYTQSKPYHYGVANNQGYEEENTEGRNGYFMD